MTCYCQHLALIPFVAAVLANFISGFLYYGPVFGKVFMSLAYPGDQKPDMSGPAMARAFGGSLLGNIIMTSVLHVVLTLAGAESLCDYLTVAFVGFLVMASNAMFHDFWEDPSMPLFVLNQGYNLVFTTLCVAVAYAFSVCTLSFCLQ